MVRRSVIALAGLALVGCGPATPEQLAMRAERDLIIDAKWRLEQAARNPDRLETRDVHIGTGQIAGMKVVCGELNGENGLGGMSGYQRFVVVDGKVPVVARTGGDPIVADLWMQAGC